MHLYIFQKPQCHIQNVKIMCCASELFPWQMGLVQTLKGVGVAEGNRKLEKSGQL